MRFSRVDMCVVLLSDVHFAAADCGSTYHHNVSSIISFQDHTTTHYHYHSSSLFFDHFLSGHFVVSSFLISWNLVIYNLCICGNVGCLLIIVSDRIESICGSNRSTAL